MSLLLPTNPSRLPRVKTNAAILLHNIVFLLFPPLTYYYNNTLTSSPPLLNPSSSIFAIMKTFIFNIVAIACAFRINVSAFSPSIPSSTIRTGPARHRSSLASATMGSSDLLGSRPTKLPRNQDTKERVKLDTIRNELIQKYINLGHSEDYATNEVNYFLEDPERSAQYVEMRRIAMARGNDLGIEMWVQFGGAFLFGWLISWAVNYFPTLQVR